MGRAPCCDKANVKKGPWSPEEDAKLKDYMEKNETGRNWIALPQKAGLRRCGKSCRLRWLNYLRPNIKHGEFSDDEDRIICTLFAAIGSRWSIIAGQLPGRTDNDIKNYWNTKLMKKLMAMGLVPHHPCHNRKPSSQSSIPPPVRSSLFADNIDNLNPLYMTSSAPPSSLDFKSAILNFSNENPSSASITTENSLLMNPSIYYPVKDNNILMFGRDRSVDSSSDHVIKKESRIGFHNYFTGGSNEVEPSIDDNQCFLATEDGLQRSDQAKDFWTEKLNEDFGEINVLKYDIGDVKKLIQRNASVFGTPFSANANKVDEGKAIYYYYF